MPYGIVIPHMGDLSQLWDHFHSGFAVVCVVHCYRHATKGGAREGGKRGGDDVTSTKRCVNLVAPDLRKVTVVHEELSIVFL